jgi:hypothetical protein
MRLSKNRRTTRKTKKATRKNKRRQTRIGMRGGSDFPLTNNGYYTTLEDEQRALSRVIIPTEITCSQFNIFLTILLRCRYIFNRNQEFLNLIYDKLNDFDIGCPELRNLISDVRDHIDTVRHMPL